MSHGTAKPQLRASSNSVASAVRIRTSTSPARHSSPTTLNSIADRASYALPFATVIRGKLTAVPAGTAQAGRLLARAAIPPDVRSRARAVLEVYSKMRISPRLAAPRYQEGAALLNFEGIV